MSKFFLASDKYFLASLLALLDFDSFNFELEIFFDLKNISNIKINNIATLNKLGLIPIVVHGGGKRINKKLSKSEKLELLRTIWKLILADGVVDKYEENLFYRIGDLIYIKRTELNKIKNT